MRFYTKQHQHYCGIDLHTNKMYLCIINQDGEIVLHRNFKANPDSLLYAIKLSREDIVVCAECMFTWYLADLCAVEYPLYPGPCSVHTGHSRWKEQERQD